MLSQVPAAQRYLSFANAFREVAHDTRQGFLRRDMRAPDVAGPIVDLGLVPRFFAGSDIDAAVVDLDLLGRVQIVENQALARSGEDHLPKLHRRQPIHMEVGHHPVAVIHVDISDVLDVRVGVSASPGGDAPRLVIEHIIDNRQIMRRQIPDDIDIVLKKPEVDADRVHVIEVAQFSVFDQLLDAPHGRVEEVRVIDHEDALFSLRQVDQRLSVLSRGRQRLFHQYMKSRLQAARRQGMMARYRCGDGHRFDSRFQQLIDGADPLHRAIGSADRFQAYRVGVADRHQLGRGRAEEVPNQVGSPVTATNHAHANSIHGLKPRRKNSQSTF